MSRRFGVALSVLLATALMAAPAAAGTVIRLSDNMEGGVGGWTFSGFWNLVNNPENIHVFNVNGAAAECPANDINPDLVTLPDTDQNGLAFLPPAFSSTHAWWYGVPAHGTFIDTNFTLTPLGPPPASPQGCKGGGTSTVANSGTLTSASIDLTGLTSATLRFKTWFEIESVDVSAFDLMRIEISLDGGSFFEIGRLNPSFEVNGAPAQPFTSGGFTSPPYNPLAAVWVDGAFSLNAYVGHHVRILFRFNTNDVLYNGFRGWLIDDVQVDGVTNDPPVANNDGPYLIAEDASSLTVAAPGVLGNDSDPNGDSITAVLNQGPAHAASFNLDPNGSFTYTPSPDYNGPDSFTYKANDGKTSGNVATVTITVTPVNDLPVANDKTATTPENTPVDVTLSGSDVETALVNFTWNVGSPAQGGTLSGVAPNLTYKPGTNFIGTDSFTYTITDRGDPDACGAPSQTCAASRTSAPATVTIKVTAVNTQPVANGQSVSTDENKPVAIFPKGSDAETTLEANLTFNVVSPTKGTLSATTGQVGQSITYTPNPGFFGSDSFAFTVTDNGNPPGCSPVSEFCAALLTSAAATVSITVNPLHGAISGQVLDAGTLAGIVGAVVDVFDATTRSFVAGGFTTGAGGSYDTGFVLLAGSYKIEARIPAALAATLSFVETFHAVAPATGIDFTTATPVAVTAGATASQKNIAMPPGGKISGTILERAVPHDPIANATVLVFRQNASNFFGRFSVQTDASGKYLFTGLRDGDWTLRVQAPGHVVSYWSGDPNDPATDSGMATPVTIAGANTVPGIDINPAAGGGSISGRVTRSDTLGPVPQGTVVQALFGQFARPSFVVQTTTTDANGNYTLSGLAAGPYVVQVLGNHAAGFANGWFPTGATNPGTALPIDVADGQTVTGKDFAVFAVTSPATLHTISGSVKDNNNQPITAASVAAIDLVTTFTVRGTTVNGDGSYAITALRPGKYVVRVSTQTTYQAVHFDGQSVPGAAAIITLASPDATDVNFTLSPTAATISGRVTRADDGTPVAGAFVNLRTFFDAVVLSTTTQRDGTYKLRGVPPDSYKIRVMEPTLVTRFYTASGTGGLTIDEADVVTVVANENRTGINIAMASGPGAIAGRLVKEVAEGVAPAVVGAVVNVREATSGGSVTFFVTRADGSWVGNGLATGDYKLRFTGLGLATEWFKDRPTRETADEVPLVAPATVTLADAQISDHAGTISGQVFASDGVTPVANVVVVVFDPSGGFVAGVGITNTAGRYVMRSGLAPGNYFALARALGYAPSFFDGFGKPGAPNLLEATLVNVADGNETPGVDFRITKSSAISGTVSYSGSLKGALVIDLFTDAGLTQRPYRLTIASPVFPQAYSFASPPPDTRGILPGTYFVAAFLDINGNGVRGADEPGGPFAASPPTAVQVGEGVTVSGINFALAVNQPPSFDQIADQTVAEDAITQSVTITGASAGPHETSQAVTVTATSSDPALIPDPMITGTGATRTLTYQPVPNTNGTALITVVAKDDGGTADGGVDSFTRTFEITVTPLNDAPAATPQSLTTAQGVPVDIVLSGTDVETAPENLAYTVVPDSGPKNGILSGSGRARAYTPNDAFVGTDSFSFTVTDRGDPDGCSPVSLTCAASLTSSAAVVSITVTAGSADVSITYFASPSPVASGRDLTYTATIRNAGPDRALGVTATTGTPAGTTFKSVTSTQGTCTAPAVGGTGPISCSLGGLARDASSSITLVVNVVAAGDTSVTSTASVSTLTADPNANNNSSTVTTSVRAAGTTSSALSVESILAPKTTTSAPQALGVIEIVENAAASLDALGRIQLKLPTGLTFSVDPTVSGLVYELTPTAVTRDAPDTISFGISRQSLTGPGRLRISNIVVLVEGGFLPGGTNSGPVVVTISGQNSGLTPASVQNGTALAQSITPTLTGVSPASAGQGTTAGQVTLTGVNFASDATVSFGTGVSATATVDSPTQITAVLTVDPLAVVGARDVTVANGTKVSTLAAVFTVTTAPTITDTDRNGTDVQGCSKGLFRGVKNQTVNIAAINVQSPPGLSVEFPGTGRIDIVTGSIGLTETGGVTLKVDLDDPLIPLGQRAVTVINPDGGRATGTITSSELGGFVDVVDVPQPPSTCPGPTAGLPVGPPQNQQQTQAPTISSLSPASEFTGQTITVNGSNFTSTMTVTFTNVNPVSVTASASSLSVVVPNTAADGPVTVTNSVGQTSNGVAFNVINPKLSGVSPTGGEQGTGEGSTPLSLTLTGSEFSGTLAVTFTPSDGITILSGPTASTDGTSIALSISIAGTAPTGLRDVTVTKTVGGVSRFSTLAGAFEVRQRVEVRFDLALVGADASTFLPSVSAVSVTLNTSGHCTAKSITPAVVTVEATFFKGAGVTADPPRRVTFEIPETTPGIRSVSRISGTAINEDCEVIPTGAPSTTTLPINDFSITSVSTTTGTVNAVTVADVSQTSSNSGKYRMKLWSWDWGGNVTIRVSGSTTVNSVSGRTVTGTIKLSADTDGDELPDEYEKNGTLNADKTGANVLDHTLRDKDANGAADGQDRFARDGLSNFAKYRGVYLKGPLANGTGAMTDHTRLGSGLRNLFVRGRGFGDDPALTSGTCGFNPSTGLPVADSTLSSTNPCPRLQVGQAFALAGVKVHNVTASFTSSTVFPKTTLDSSKQAGTATLDMATVVYNAVGCAEGETCDHTSKSGVRQWAFPTLGFSTFGSSTAYASDTRVFKKGVDAYFRDKPYEHRTNDTTRVVTASDGRAMLAPITIVGDSSSQGADNGVINSGEATVAGQLAGDTYIPGAFDKQLSAMDATNDGCVELPLASDPTLMSTACNPAADSASSGQATKQQVVRFLITHELGHAVGITLHTTDTSDVMYEFSINWERDQFSSDAASLLQIHNKGMQ